MSLDLASWLHLQTFFLIIILYFAPLSSCPLQRMGLNYNMGAKDIISKRGGNFSHHHQI